MATVPKFYKKEIVDALVAETWKCALLTSGHTINAGTQQTYANVSANEVSAVGTGYTAGGNTVVGKVANYDGTGLNAYITATALQFTGLTATPHYAVLYETAGGKIRSQIDFGADYPVVAGTLTLTWNANGIIKVS